MGKGRQVTEARPLPSDIVRERDLIACLCWLGDHDFARTTLAEIPEDAWFHAQHRGCAEALTRLATVGVCDFDALLGEVRRDDSSGIDAEYLTSWDGTPTKELARHLSGVLTKLAHRRALITAASATMTDAWNEETPIADIENDAGVSHKDRSNTYSEPGAVSMAAAVKSWDDYVARINCGQSRLHSGLQEVDAKAPILPEFNVICARTNVGKTALSLSMALNQLMQGKHVAFFSMEQPAAVIVTKMISLMTGLSGQAVLGTGPSDSHAADDVAAARECLFNMPFYLIGKRQSAAAVWSTCARLHDEHELHVIYIDQLSKFLLPDGGRQKTKEMLLGELSDSLVDMLHDIGIPGFLLAQLGLAHANNRDSKTPHKEQLRDCRKILEDAARVWVIDRPEIDAERLEKIDVKLKRYREKGDHDDAAFYDPRGAGYIAQEKDQNGSGGGHWRVRVEFNDICGRFGPGPRRMVEDEQKEESV